MGLERVHIIIVCCLVLFLFFWSSVTQIEVATHAAGKVVPSGNVRKIQNLEGGIIRDIFVVEGQQIQGGEKVLEFEAVASESEVGELEAHLAFLSIEVAVIEATLTNKTINIPANLKVKFPDLIRASENQMSAKQTLLDSQILVLKNQIDTKRSQKVANASLTLEKKKAKSLLRNQINLSSGEATEINKQKLKEKEKLLDYLQEQVVLSEKDLVDINTAKLSQKKEMLGYLEEQIKISDDLLSEKITSELAHLDLLRAKQAVKIEIEELKGREKQRELSHLSLLQTRQVTKAEIQELRAQQVDVELEILELKRQNQRLNAELSDLLQTNKDLDNQISTLNSEILVSKNSFTEELTQLFQKYNDELNKYEKRLARFEDELGRRLVKSPIDGVVKKVHFFTLGGVVQPGMDLVEIVPSNETLVVEAELPVGDVGFVNLNQKVKIRLGGIKGAEYEPISGIVEQVSPDTLEKKDGQEFYKVKVSTLQNKFISKGAEYPLRPGLLVDCSFVITTRSLLENLLAPFISARSKAFTENVWTSSVERELWRSRFQDFILSPLSKVVQPV